MNERITVIGRMVMVHPEDINLADAKALAAKHNTSVVGNPHCPRGSMFLMDDLNLYPPAPTQDRGTGEEDQ